jgi:hypothetical protein
MYYDNLALIIKYLKPTDSGVYYCKMNNIFISIVIGLFTVNVIDTNPQIVTFEQNKTLNCNQSYVSDVLIKKTFSLTW